MKTNYRDITPLSYLGNTVGNFSAHCQALDEGASSNEGARDLNLQFPWHIPERLQLVGVLAHTLQVVLAEVILGVYQLEHPLQEPRPEVIEHLLQVDVPPCVVPFQLSEEVLKHLRILHVQHPIGPDKHVIEGLLRILQQLAEKF